MMIEILHVWGGSMYVAMGGSMIVAFHTVNPTNAANKKVTWSTSNRTIATVNRSGSTATITGIAVGSATITVTTADGRFTDTCTVTVATLLTGIGSISGTPVIGETLTAGALTPAGATANYQWTRSLTSGGSYSSISGETGVTHVLDAADVGCFIKVVATGSSSYTGTVTSRATPQITAPLTGIGSITGTTALTQTLFAGVLTPSGATATYQWQRADTAGGSYTAISGATSSSYFLDTGDLGKYIKVTATGSGFYTGTVISEAVSVSAGSATLPFTQDFTGTVEGSLLRDGLKYIL